MRNPAVGIVVGVMAALLVSTCVPAQADSFQWKLRSELRDPPPSVGAVEFSPDGKEFALAMCRYPSSGLAEGNGRVEIRDAVAFKVLTTFAIGEPVFDLKYVGASSLATGSSRLQVWDTKNGKRTALLADEGQKVVNNYQHLTFVPNRNWLAANGKIWDVQKNVPASNPPDFDLRVWGESPDDPFLISPDGTVALVRTRTRRTKVRTWDTDSWNQLGALDVPDDATEEAQLGIGTLLAFSPDSKLILCGKGLLDARTLKMVSVLAIKSCEVPAGFSPDGRTCYAGTDFFTIDSGKPVTKVAVEPIEMIRGMTISPDGNVLIVTG